MCRSIGFPVGRPSIPSSSDPDADCIRWLSSGVGVHHITWIHAVLNPTALGRGETSQHVRFRFYRRYCYSRTFWRIKSTLKLLKRLLNTISVPESPKNQKKTTFRLKKPLKSKMASPRPYTVTALPLRALVPRISVAPLVLLWTDS